MAALAAAADTTVEQGPMIPKASKVATVIAVTHAMPKAQVETTAKEINNVQQVPVASAASVVTNPTPQNHHKSFVMCREKEQAFIERFLSINLRKRKGDLLYIYGGPGIGKTFTMDFIISNKCALLDNCLLHKVNVMDLHTSTIQSICHDTLLHLNPNNYKTKGCKSALELFSSFCCLSTTETSTESSPMVILIIDEMDQLIKQKNFHQLCEISSREYSRLILVGIANVPHLKLNFIHKSLCFRRYTRDQLFQIAKQNLVKSDDNDKQSELELKLLTARVANISGDFRRVKDVVGSKRKADVSLMSSVPKKTKDDNDEPFLISTSDFEFKDKIITMTRNAQTTLACVLFSTLHLTLKTKKRGEIVATFDHIVNTKNEKLSNTHSRSICNLLDGIAELHAKAFVNYDAKKQIVTLTVDIKDITDAIETFKDDNEPCSLLLLRWFDAFHKFQTL